MSTPLPGLEFVAPFLSAADRLSPGSVPLTERVYVERLLSFANGDNLVGDYLDLISDRAMNVNTNGDRWDWRKTELVPAATLAAQWLETLLTRGVTVQLAATVLPLAERSVLRPSYQRLSGHIVAKYRHYPVDVEAAVARGVLLLMDRELPYGEDLCRCKYSECNRFFLAVRPATGRPRRDYHTTECFNAARKASAADRIRGYRAKRKLASTKRRRRIK